MKRFTTLALLLLTIAAVPAFALDETKADERRDGRVADRDRTTIIDDVIRMSQAGVSDEAIVRFVKESRDGFVVDADTIIRLNDAHVSKAVMNALMDEAYDRGRNDGRRRDGDRVVRERVYVQPYVGYYDPFWSPYYDPFWYGPRVSIGIGFGRWFGGGRYHGGHFRHR